MSLPQPGIKLATLLRVIGTDYTDVNQPII
jgi:hypothetical protein